MPFMKIFPEVGLSKVPRIFNKVDFPLPDGPTMHTNSPNFILKLIFFKIIISPVEEK